MINLSPLPADTVNRVLHLELRDDQLGFVHPIKDMVGEISDNVEFHAIDRNGEAVGFFKIDVCYEAGHVYARRGEAGLRGFLIGAQYQGEGIASAAVAKLPDYLRQCYPSQVSVVLTVNKSNPRAAHVYLAGGFTDTGKIYEGGNSGPQHIMRLNLQH